MSAARWIEHVTLTTGHSRRSYADEIAPETLAAGRRIIDRMTGGDPAVSQSVPIGVPGYSVAGRATKRALVATVYADGPPSELIATIGVARSSLGGATLWRELHRWGSAPVKTDPQRPPPEPWVAASLEEPIVRHMDATAWLGDFERCLAWAFLSRAEH